MPHTATGAPDLADPEDPTKPPGFIERRRRPRNAGDKTSWEQVAIQRVTGRVKALPEPGGEGEDFGWERAVLERLRKRIDRPGDV